MYSDKVKNAQNGIDECQICISQAEKVVEYLRSDQNHTLEDCRRIAPDITSFLDLDKMQKELVLFIEMKKNWQKELDILINYPHSSCCTKRYWYTTWKTRHEHPASCTNCGTYHLSFNGNGTNSVYSSCGECCEEVFGKGGCNDNGYKEKGHLSIIDDFVLKFYK